MEVDEKGSENVEYVSEQLDIQGTALEAFSDIFARFQLPPDESSVRADNFGILLLGLSHLLHRENLTN